MQPVLSSLIRTVFALSLTLVAAQGALLPAPARAANVLVVSDGDSDMGIADVLVLDGHTVTRAMNDGSAPVSVLVGDLSGYDAVVWSGTTGFRPAAVFTNLTAYVTAGGRVFYTGYDSTLGDAAVQAFLGCTGAYDFPTAPGPIAMVDNPLTTGLLDIRGVTPTGYHTDRDGITGLLPGTVSVSADTGGRGGHEWALRTLGDGFVAWVSNGTYSGTHASWSTATGTLGARAYNAAVRNFVYNAGGFSGACTGEGTACTSSTGRSGVCRTDRCCVGCWDGTRCYAGTTGTECGVAGGACISCADGMACTLDVCTAGVCSNPMAPEGHACQDGEFCTVGETCDATGTCRGGRPNLCDDMSACTTDTCDEATDACLHEPGGSGCFIAGTCYGAFTVNATNRCQMCDPSRSVTAWSPRTVGTPCGTASCTGGPGAAMLNDGGRCDAAGACATSTPTPCPQGLCAPGGASCASTCTIGSCPAGRICNGVTMTCVPPGGLGSTCGTGTDCASGFCADGVCCSSRCDQLCDACDLAGSIGTCRPTPVGGACGVPVCSGTNITRRGTCDAAGMCTRPAPERCPQGFCLDGTECSPTCTPGSCAPGEICTEERLCVTPAADGTRCGADDHCISGHCADGVCCNVACDDYCESCVQADRIGRCTPYLAGSDPELECPIGAVCSGGRSCMIAPDAGPIDAGLDGALPDADPFPRERRDCSCAAAGAGARGGGAALLMGLVALLRARRRHGAAG